MLSERTIRFRGNRVNIFREFHDYRGTAGTYAVPAVPCMMLVSILSPCAGTLTFVYRQYLPGTLLSFREVIRARNWNG